MCVAIPCRIEAFEVDTTGARPARVSLPDGSFRVVDLVMVPEAGVGDYVITHSGFAITLLTSSTAEATIELMTGGGEGRVAREGLDQRI